MSHTTEYAVCPYHRHVGVHGVELEVDLLVDALLGFLVVVLAYLTHLVFSSLVGRCSIQEKSRGIVALTKQRVRAVTATARQLGAIAGRGAFMKTG